MSHTSRLLFDTCQFLSTVEYICVRWTLPCLWLCYNDIFNWLVGTQAILTLPLTILSHETSICSSSGDSADLEASALLLPGWRRAASALGLLSSPYRTTSVPGLSSLCRQQRDSAALLHYLSLM